MIVPRVCPNSDVDASMVKPGQLWRAPAGHRLCARQWTIAGVANGHVDLTCNGMYATITIGALLANWTRDA